MIRHEVIIRVKPDVNRDAIESVLREAYELLADLPGVERVRYGVNNAAAYRHAMLVVELTDEQALHRFGRHPQHARAVRIINRLAESSSVGSFSVRSESR
jgi:hypothetical protein